MQNPNAVFPRAPRSPRRLAAVAASTLIVVVATASWWILDLQARRPPDSILVPVSRETAPVANQGDAADDPAIWNHPLDPMLSLILGTDKKGGLHVYDLAGNEVQHFEQEEQNNVDLRSDFDVGDGETTIVVTSSYENDRLLFYRLDADTRWLEFLPESRLALGVEPKGVCLFHDPVSRRLFVFVTGEDARDETQDGIVEQYELSWNHARERLDAELVRRFDVGGRIEGCAADDDLGHFFVSEENVGVWRYSAYPSGGEVRTVIDRVQPEGRIRAHCEGIAIYRKVTGGGYLIVSSQSSDDFCVYDRLPPHRYLGRFGLVEGAGADEVTHTDGIEVCSIAYGDAFPAGIFIAHDDKNDDGNQNYKFASWKAIESALQGVH
jgi:3-phytase